MIRPPITTVANGRCTSAPALVAIAIGTNPNEATRPVRNTGRNKCGVLRLIMRFVESDYRLQNYHDKHYNHGPDSAM